MFDPNTMKGLDGAIEDLQKAVEALPDGPLKKKLNQRLERMRIIRERMESHKAFRKSHPFISLTILTIIIIVFLYVAGRLRIAYTRNRHIN